MLMELLRALALVFVIEGLMPFIAPERWRETILRLAGAEPRQLRLFGGVLIGAGVIALQLLHWGF